MIQISQEVYAAATIAVRNNMAKALKDPELSKIIKRAFPKDLGGEVERGKWRLDDDRVKAAGRAYMKAMHSAMKKAGVTSSLGFNFYDLRGPAYFIFPFLTPLLQSIGSEGKVNAGTGTVANWKATRNPSSPIIYGGLAEGQRNQLATPDEVNYFATYKEVGFDAGVSFTAQFAGEGFTDNQADEHFRNLVRVRLAEEMLTLCGNSGPTTVSNVSTGNLGFALGKCPTPTNALVVGSGLATSSNVYVACVPITAMGMAAGGQAGYGAAPSVAGGLTVPYTRTNQDGTSLNVNTGIGQISNISTVATTNATAGIVNASVAAVKGAVAYAWFWGVNVASALGNLNLGAITSAPWVAINAVATGSQLANVASFGNDNSYQVTDFDGLFTYTINNGTWTDMGGGSFTPAGSSEVAELETDLYNMWTKYQAQPTTIYCSGDVRKSLDQAITYTNTATNGYMFVTTRDAQDSGLLGGFVVSGYKSKYALNPSGGSEIPIRIHPMLPPGTLMYDIEINPYPHSRTPGVRNFLLQRDYYAIEWPLLSRQWTFGTYKHEVLAHYMPWITAVRTGIGAFVPPCWLAAAAFGESFFDGPTVVRVRERVLAWERSGSLAAKIVVGLYRAHGEAAAKLVAKSETAKRVVRGFFNRVLAS